jgi:hypothetical protein
MNEPQTPQEWQDAVDAAQGALAVDSARKYGFITGGPEVNVERCEAILARGAEQGYRPSLMAIERFAAEVARP